MNISVEDLGKCRKTIRIEVPAERVTAEITKAAQEYSKYARLPGFRPGKAPVSLIRQHYQKEILKDVKDHILPLAYHNAVDREKLDVVRIVDFEEPEVKAHTPMAFSITVDTRPEFALPEYKGIALTRKPVSISEEEVSGALDGIRERCAQFEDTEDHPLAAGDLARIDFVGTVDGKNLEEVAPDATDLGKGEDFWTRLDPDAFIPELATALAGRKIGETVEVETTFPEDFVLEALRNVKANYTVTITGIRQKKLPDLDDAFVQRMGEESMEALRNGLRNDLESNAIGAENARLRSEIHQFLIGAVSVDVPESMVEDETQHIVRDTLRNNLQQGASEDILRQHAEEIHANASKVAAQQVKLRFILMQIAKEEGLRVESAEVDEEIERLAPRYGLTAGVLRKRLTDNKTLDDFRFDILMRKTTDRLLEIANISE